MEKTSHSWLESNTFDNSEFWDLLKLIEEKERKGLKVSLCIPTLNEEKTIGKEIIIFKSELMTRYPLLDEIAVVDSGSNDQTREVAASFGAEVYLASEILPEEGDRKGKGENLWKAIYQLKGDIIVYVDADITNIHPRFVYGLVGPLIYNDQVQYVKAFYDRPLAFSQGIRPSGGGRVTEILVRPLFSMFFPELSAVIQPLSGEYAVRRPVLERIPFPIGYGVETAHLLDVYREWGMDAFAQTDLDQRVHRNQTTIALGRMSFGILQTFLHRMERFGMIKELGELNQVYRHFEAQDRHYHLKERLIQEEERRPMIEVPAYQEKFSVTP